jgi:hypothetical protein
MGRDRWLIGLAALVAVLGMAVFGLRLSTEKRREAAVGKLKTKTAAFEQRLLRRTPPEAPEPLGAAGPQQAESSEPEPPEEDYTAAFDRLIEKKKALDSEPRWQEALELIGDTKWGEWTEADRQRVAEFLEANRDLILELRRLAEAGGALYELDYSQGFSMALPHLAQLRHCARMLAADAALAAARGEYEETIKDFVAGRKLAASVGKEPILISQLVRMAIDGIMYHNVEQSVRGEELTPDLAAVLMGYASGAGGRDSLADSLSVEGLFGLEAFEGIRTGDLNHIGMAPEGVETILIRLYGTGLARPLLNRDEETYADIMARMSDIVRLPFYEAKPSLDQINAEIDGLPRTRFLSRTLLPALTRAAEAQARNEAQWGLMQMGLAVEQYHVQHGEYPQTLDQVAPIVGGAIPLDPFTGQPYVYQPSSGTFVLYSAMGSVIDPGDRSRPQGMDDQGNLVWRGPR